MADLPALLERLKNDADKRPLLAGDLREKLAALLEKRREHYASFPLQLKLDGMSSAQCSFEIQTILGRFHLSAMGEYDVTVDQTQTSLPGCLTRYKIPLS